jgi:recombination protein RecA
MAKQQKNESIQKTDISFDFFSQEVNDTEAGVNIISADSMIDPDANQSGSYNLDYDLIVPFPEGRIAEIYGAESTCKTTLALEVAGQALQKGKTVLYINMEKNLNVSLMRTIRTIRPYLDQALEQVNKDKDNQCPLWIAMASNGEQAFEIMRKFSSMMPHGIAILDSIDAAQPEAVLSGEIGENKVGNLAKLMSDAMRKLIGVAETNKVSLIFINQIRDKITMYGNPNTTPGGAALKFYASQRIEVKKPRKDDIIVLPDGEKIGVVIRYTIIKNKFAPDGNEGAFPVLHKNGIFREQELIMQCCNFGILKLGGKGGKQVYLPKLDRNKNDFVTKNGEIEGSWMSQFEASRRLLIDPALAAKFSDSLRDILQENRQDPVDTLLDEVQDPE